MGAIYRCLLYLQVTPPPGRYTSDVVRGRNLPVKSLWRLRTSATTNTTLANLLLPPTNQKRQMKFLIMLLKTDVFNILQNNGDLRKKGLCCMEWIDILLSFCFENRNWNVF